MVLAAKDGQPRRNELKVAVLFFLLLSFSASTFANTSVTPDFLREPAAEDSKSNNHKFEDLFIWKISDEMKLSPADEKTFSELIRGLNQKRQDLNESMQDTLRKLKDAKAKAEQSKLIAQYRDQMKKHSQLGVDEIDQIKKALGPEKAAQYLILKNELMTQLRTKLTKSESDKDKTILKAPQIIEEK
jgi:hypothetical protein